MSVGEMKWALKADRADFPTETFVLGTRDFHIQGVAVKIVERDL